MSFRDRIKRSRTSFSERMNILFRRGPKLDDDFWDDLEETLILSDLGGSASMKVVENLRDQATRKALPDAYAVLDLLADEIADLFTPADPDPFTMNPVCVLFVGVNGAGKTTTVGKLAYQATLGGRKVLIGSADTFRAAAIEQLDVWGKRSGVEVVERERGADPASVCYDVCARAEELRSDLVLIDTSGRLHTSAELMRELQKVVNVTRKRADMDVKTVLVIDATTGQNGLQQAREFDKALDLDGIIMTKLDGTAKGGIAVAISHELGLPICRVGVGEGIEDLQPFDAYEYAEALFGEMREEAGGEHDEAPSTSKREAAATLEVPEEEEPAAAEEGEEAAEPEAAEGAEPAAAKPEAVVESKAAAEPAETEPEAVADAESAAVEPEAAAEPAEPVFAETPVPEQAEVSEPATAPEAPAGVDASTDVPAQNEGVVKSPAEETAEPVPEPAEPIEPADEEAESAESEEDEESGKKKETLRQKMRRWFS